MNALAATPELAPAVGNADALFTELYAQLHRLAGKKLREHGRLPIGATTLVHEAYVAIANKPEVPFLGRGGFMSYAARVMRGLIIDSIRRQQSQKRGGLIEITSLRNDHGERIMEQPPLTHINDAIDELAEVEPELAEVVELKFFCGLSFDEIAALRGVSTRTITRQWEKGRLYLHHAIRGADTARVKARDHASEQ